MRARDRQRWEREVARLCEGIPDVQVVWARYLPGAWGAYVPWGSAGVWIVLDEGQSLEELRDTVAHECAHVLAERQHGSEIQAHGREFRRWYRRCKKALDGSLDAR